MVGMLNAYIKPRISNQVLYRKYTSVSASNTIQALYYNNVGGTILPLKIAKLNTYTNFPAPRTGIANTTVFDDYIQAPFTYFNGALTESGPYTYPDAVNIPFLSAPTTNSPQYVENQVYTHNSGITRTYFFQLEYAGNGLGATTGSLTFYLYHNGVEIQRCGQYSTTTSSNKGSTMQALVTLAPNDTIELRYSQANSTGSSERIRNFNYSFYELKN